MEKLNNISSDVAEIKTTLTCHVEAQTRFEQESVTSRALLRKQIETTDEKVKDHEVRLKELEDAVKEFATTNRAIKWMAGVLVTTIVAFIWAMITGQATVVLR